jgi:hypothetical protein
MKRFLVSALTLGVFCIFTGCDSEKTKVEDVKKVETPGGSTTVKDSKEIKKTGDEKTGAPTKP